MGRRGQASTEYLLLLCTVLCMSLLTGSFLARYGRELTDRMAEKLLDAALELSRP
ncbi:MAG: hypothetical protein SF051_06350 [Elusimicrobiota bacterium]|nr:hypothetical protein [Elusimicrobiota bacterium]